jgi:beta-lactamase class A
MRQVRQLRRVGQMTLVTTLGVVASLLLGGCFEDSSPTSATGPVAATATQPATAVSIGINAETVMSAALPAELEAYIKYQHQAGAVGVVGITVLDQATGASVSVNDGLETQTASIMKVDILATRLLQHQDQGTGLTSHEKSLAFVMITKSDNSAATALFQADGGVSGVTKANRAFGLTDTQPNFRWGVTHTKPADQLRLLKSITDENGPLTTANRKYLLSLMSQVEPDQRWGVPAAAGPGSTAYVKNGWDTFDQYAHQWGINTIGRIVEPGHDFLIVALSRNNPGENRAERFLGTLCKMAVDGLRQLTKAATEE